MIQLKEDKKLIIGMTVFSLFVFIIFSFIIINEKTLLYSKTKQKKKLINYIEKKYPNTNWNYKEIQQKKNTYSMKVVATTNKNYFFFVTYQNKKISDTYQKDYIKGASILNYTQKKLEQEIKKKTKKEYKVKIIAPLNQFSKQTQKKIIEEENILALNIYSLELKINTKWNKEEIIEEIKKEVSSLENLGIKPNSYQIIVSNKNKQKQTFELNDITKEEIYQQSFISTITSYIV